MGKYNSFNSNPYSAHQKICSYVKEGKVLDVGCAEGNLSKMMKMKGCHVFGVEIDENSAKIAKKYCEKVIIGNVEKIKLPDEYENYFDYIVLADVVEHLKEPLDFILRFKNYLKDDGKLIISVPNITNWRIRMNIILGKWNYTKYGILDEGHLRFFNEKGAKKLFHDSGFVIDKFDLTVGDVNHFQHLLYLIGLKFPNLLAFQFLICGRKEVI